MRGEMQEVIQQFNTRTHHEQMQPHKDHEAGDACMGLEQHVLRNEASITSSTALKFTHFSCPDL